MGRPLGGVWCARRGSDESLGLTASSPRGFGRSDRKCVYFLHFRFEIREEGVRKDIGERLHQVGVHVAFGSLRWVR
jgi:hypothetical protein